MFRILILIMLAVAVAAVVAPGIREIVAWVLAFLSALMLGDLLRGSLGKRRRRNHHIAP